MSSHARLLPGFKAVSRVFWRQVVHLSPAGNCRIRVLQSTRGLQSDHRPVDKKLVEKLPLAGIRVLDLTRVLAGVGDFRFGGCELGMVN